MIKNTYLKISLILLFSFILLGIIADFILSKDFLADKLKKIVFSQIPKEFARSLDFKGVQIGVFPPRVLIKEFSFKKENFLNFESIFINLEEIDIRLNLFSSKKDKIYLSNVSLKHGKVELSKSNTDTSEERTEWSEEQILSLIKKRFNGIELGKIILSRVSVEDVEFELKNEFSFYSLASSFEVYGKEILNDIHLESIHIPKLENLKISYLDLRSTLNKNVYEFENFELARGGSVFTLDGRIEKPFSSKDRVFDINYQLLATFIDFVPSEILKEFELDGVIELTGTAKGKGVVEKLNSNVVLHDVKSKFLDIDKGTGTLVYNDQELKLNNFSFERNSGKALLLSPLSIYNFKNKAILSNAIEIELKSLDLKDALRSVPKVASFLSGPATGSISVKINKEGVRCKTISELQVSKFKFVVDQSKEVFALPGLTLSESDFFYNFKAKNLDIITEAKFLENKLTAKGFISKNEIDVKTNLFSIDFDKEFTHLAGKEIAGKGEIEIKVKGPIDNSEMIFGLNLQNASYAGFYLGNAKGNLTFSLKELELGIENLTGEITDGSYNALGSLNFKKNKIAIRAQLKSMSLESIEKIHRPLLKKIPPEVWQFSSGHINAIYNFSGGIDLDSLVVKANFYSDQLILFKEKLTNLKSKFQYSNQALSFSDLSFYVGDGKISGFFDFENEKMKYGFKSENLSSRDLNLFLFNKTGLDGKISLQLTGDSKEVLLKLGLTDTFLSGNRVDDSLIYLKKSNSQYAFKINYLKDVVNLAGLVDLDSKTKNSWVRSSFKVPHWSYLLNLIDSYDAEDEFLAGEFIANFEGRFNYYDLDLLDLEGSIQSFKFSHPQINIRSIKENSVVINRGVIQKWNLEIIGEGPREYIRSKGSGSFFDNYILSLDTGLDLSKISRIASNAYNFSGDFFVKSEIAGSKGSSPRLSTAIDGKGISLTRIDLYTSIRGLDFKILGKDFDFQIKKFTSNVGSGNLGLSGSVAFEDFMPVFDLEYDLNSASMYFQKESFVSITGAGSFIGRKIPYTLSGDLKIQGGELFDELEEFSSDNKKSSVKFNNNFFPENEKGITPELVNLNINSVFTRPLVIKNSIVNLKMLGNMNIAGSNSNPLLFGKIYTTSDPSNKITIKSNSLNVDKFIILFNGEREYLNPLIDFAAVANVADYKVSVKSYGPVNQLATDFTSDPYLDRQSILSLLAFGYAEEVTDRLSESDRESLSSVGVGSFIFNKLKLNEALEESFGVKLKVDTVFEQDEASLLEGRTQSGRSSGDVRSATTVEISKELTKDVDLSLSSSISGSIGQQQKMNLRYELKDNVSVEGVYEVRTDEEGEEGGVETSYGTDMRFRWTFE